MTLSQCSHLYNGKVFPAVIVGQERGICEVWKVASVLVQHSCGLLKPWEIAEYEEVNQENHTSRALMGPLSGWGLGFDICMYPRNYAGMSFNSDAMWW